MLLEPILSFANATIFRTKPYLYLMTMPPREADLPSIVSFLRIGRHVLYRFNLIIKDSLTHTSSSAGFELNHGQVGTLN